MTRRWGCSVALLTAVFLAGVLLAQLTPAPAQVTPGRPQVVNVQHISTVVHIAAAAAPWPFSMAMATRCVNTAGTAFEACGGGAGGGDAVNVFHQSTIRHISSITHVGGTISLVNQAGTYATFTGTTLDVTCTGCAAASVVAVSHISGAVHIGGTIGGAQFHIQGLGTPGQSHGGVLSIQGIGGGNPVPVIGTIGLPVNQQGVWNIQATHQGGQWNMAHVTSVTHVAVTAFGSTAVDPCMGRSKSYVGISQTAGTQLVTGVANQRVYVCSLNVVSATAQNLAVVAGTGVTCATTTVGVPGLTGGATAATGWNLAANGGLTFGAGAAAIAQTTVNGDSVCLLQSGTGQVSGGLSYVTQ